MSQNGKPPLLKAENISLRFGGLNALTDISFEIYPGEILAIIGPNGAGKSSMLNVINGFYRPIEIRQDLLPDSTSRREWAAMLADCLQPILENDELYRFFSGTTAG